jgi:hypothetical protein
MITDYTLEQISPQKAAEMLGQNPVNRTLREEVVQQYARDMRAGLWRINGESIKFGIAGELLDGQHRLKACIAAEMSFQTIVVRGLTEADRDTVDRGIKRTYGDILKMRGESHVVLLAGIIAKIHRYEKYGLRTAFAQEKTRYSSNELDATFNRHPGLRGYAKRAEQVSKPMKLAPSTVALLMWLFDQKNREDCEWFFHKLVTGEDLPSGHPLLTLRRTLFNLNESPHGKNPLIVAAIIVKAWNAYREGRTLGVLTYRVGGSQPETFPEPV